MTKEGGPMVSAYINRLHDEMLVGLFRAMRKGNFLLVGRRGDGKSSALMTFSDRLIDVGAEFSMMPVSPRGRTFVPPFAKINLIDDVHLQISEALIGAIERSRATSLNIMTAEPEAVERLRKGISLDGVIEIGTLSVEEQAALISEWQKANGIDRGIARSRKDLENYLKEKNQNPRQLKLLLDSVQRRSVTLLTNPELTEKIELVRPRILTLNKNLADAIRTNPSRLDALSPDQFEEFIAELFEEQGYRVTLTKKSRDGGVDVIAEKKDIIDFSVLAQCKKYASHRPIGAHVIREMTGVLDINKATAGAIFTTSRFTPAAIQEARMIRHKLSLHDYFDILMCLHRSGQFKP